MGTEGELEVSVLGAVRARRGDDDLPLGGRRQRSVLARLALAGGRAVDVGRLIDEVWAGDPPASALNTLQSYVSNLRRVLGPDVIVRAGDGYRLVGVELVAVHFEQAVAAATSPAVGPAERLARLDAALALWHGAPLGDLADEAWAVGDALAARASLASAPAIVAALDLDRVAAAGDDLLGYLVLDLLAEVAWLLGSAPLGAAVAAAVAAAAAPFAGRVGVIGQGAIITGPVHRPHGLALAATGELAAAEAALGRAVAVGEERGWRPTVGRASLERAEVLDRLGRSEEAAARAVGEAALAGTPVAPLGPLA